MIFWLTCNKVQFYSIWQTVLDRWRKRKKMLLALAMLNALGYLTHLHRVWG